MADYDGSPQRDDRHHRRSRSCSPVSPDWTGETPAEREERRLAEAAVLVGPPAGQPGAASANTGPSTQEPEPAQVTAPATQAASPAAPPWEGAPDARGAETAAPASNAAAPTAAPGTPPIRGVAPAQEPGASPRAAAAAEGSGQGARGVATAASASRATASGGHAAAPSMPRKRGKDPGRATGASPAAAAAAGVGREGAKYRARANPTHTNTSPPKPFPPKPFPPYNRVATAKKLSVACPKPHSKVHALGARDLCEPQNKPHIDNNNATGRRQTSMSYAAQR